MGFEEGKGLWPCFGVSFALAQKPRRLRPALCTRIVEMPLGNTRTFLTQRQRQRERLEKAVWYWRMGQDRQKPSSHLEPYSVPTSAFDVSSITFPSTFRLPSSCMTCTSAQTGLCSHLVNEQIQSSYVPTPTRMAES